MPPAPPLSLDSYIEQLKPQSAEAAILIGNGIYYQQSGNLIGALISYSNAATYIFASSDATAREALKKNPSFQLLLGYIEQLQEKVKNLNKYMNNEDKKEAEYIDCSLQKPLDSKELKLSFKDVIGMHKEKKMIETAIVKPLVFPNLFTKTAKGVLLYGPPGTGKTYLAKACVRYLQETFKESASVLFFALTGADLKGKYVGETEQKIVKAYTCASKMACMATDRVEEPVAGDAPTKQKQYISVIFIDEFDSIGGDRSQDDTGMVANAVNTLLQMMDGVKSFKNVITVAATNYPWSLDAALLRRFNEHIYCRVPKLDDITKLINKEISDRFTIVKTDLLEYCAGLSLGEEKLYPKTARTADIYGKKKARESKEAETTKGIVDDVQKQLKLYSFLNEIDISYLNDASDDRIAVSGMLAQLHYSNSDVASVMQKAFNKVAEIAVDTGDWRKISEDPYYVSCFTVLKNDTSLTTLIEAQANTDSDYNSDKFEAAINKIDYKGTNRLLELKSIARSSPWVDDTIDTANIIANICVDGEHYTNILFLNNRPSWLIMDTTNMFGLYVRNAGANSLANLRGVVAPALHDKIYLDVVFARVLTVTNDPSSQSSVQFLLKKEEMRDAIKNMDVYMEREILDVDDQLRGGPGYEYKGTNLRDWKIILETLQGALKFFSIGYNADNFPLKTQEPLINSLLANLDKLDNTKDWNFEELCKSQRTYLGFLASAVRQDCFSTFQKAYINASSKQLIKDFIENSDKLTVDFKRLKSGKKLFFFKATIKPFSAKWKEFRASGSYAIAGVVDFFSKIYKTATFFLPGAPAESKEDVLRAYLSSEKVTLCEYLLARTTHVGILNNDVEDDGDILFEAFDKRAQADAKKKAAAAAADAAAKRAAAAVRPEPETPPGSPRAQAQASDPSSPERIVHEEVGDAPDAYQRALQGPGLPPLSTGGKRRGRNWETQRLSYRKNNKTRRANRSYESQSGGALSHKFVNEGNRLDDVKINEIKDVLKKQIPLDSWPNVELSGLTLEQRTTLTKEINQIVKPGTMEYYFKAMKNRPEQYNIIWFEMNTPKTHFIANADLPSWANLPRRMKNIFKGFTGERDIFIENIIFKEVFMQDNFYINSDLRLNFIQNFQLCYNKTILQSPEFVFISDKVPPTFNTKTFGGLNPQRHASIAGKFLQGIGLAAAVTIQPIITGLLNVPAAAAPVAAAAAPAAAAAAPAAAAAAAAAPAAAAPAAAGLGVNAFLGFINYAAVAVGGYIGAPFYILIGAVCTIGVIVGVSAGIQYFEGAQENTVTIQCTLSGTAGAPIENNLVAAIKTFKILFMKEYLEKSNFVADEYIQAFMNEICTPKYLVQKNKADDFSLSLNSTVLNMPKLEVPVQGGPVGLASTTNLTVLTQEKEKTAAALQKATAERDAAVLALGTAPQDPRLEQEVKDKNAELARVTTEDNDAAERLAKAQTSAIAGDRTKLHTNLINALQSLLKRAYKKNYGPYIFAGKCIPSRQGQADIPVWNVLFVGLKADTTRFINVKTIVAADAELDDNKKLSFYMDTSFIRAAAAEYPTTWDETTGQALERYDANRSQFFADLKSGAFKLKKKQQ